MIRLVKHQPYTLTGFLPGVAVTLFCAVQGVGSLLYWSGPARQSQQVQP